MKTKILLILVVAIAVLIGLILLSQPFSTPEEQAKPEASEETKETPSQPEYPNNLIEGTIKAVDFEAKTLKLEAKTSLIKTAERDIMEKTIRFTDETEWAVYNITNEEESFLEPSEIKVDDGIVVTTVESTFDKINELEEFTASKITKMVAE